MTAITAHAPVPSLLTSLQRAGWGDLAGREWVDEPTLFLRCTAWRELAENVAESLTKGTRVIAQGRLVQRSYETREGEQRTVVELQVDEVGPSLRWATARVARAPRGSAPARDGWSGPPADHDPWATDGAPPAQPDEPPF